MANFDYRFASYNGSMLKMLYRKTLPQLSCLLLVLIATIPAMADGPADNIPTNVRRIPKLGVEVPAAVRQELEKGLAEL